MTASVVALLTGKEFFSSVRGLVILEMTSTIARNVDDDGDDLDDVEDDAGVCVEVDVEVLLHVSLL